MYTAQFPLALTLEGLRDEEIDLRSMVNGVCERIEAIEPHIEALVPESDRRRRLLNEVEALRERYPDPARRPPLYGVLFGVKDIFTVDGFTTRAGSQLPAELFGGAEAACVRRLREAGALVLGLTVAAEFAYFEPGPTRNPHNPFYSPGGSSSGSAAAVAAGYCQLALGTQTTGSIIRPAAYCGIVGVKPSYGRIATNGLIVCAETLDTAGYFTQDLAGAQLVASLLCTDWQALSAPVSKPVLGIPEGPYLSQATGEALAVFEQQLVCLAKAGYTLHRVPALPDIAAINHRHHRLVCAEMARAHADWFGQYEVLYRPRTAAAIRDGQAISYPEYDLYRASPQALRLEMETLMDATGIDYWVCPAAPASAPEGITTTGDPVMNLPWTHAGMPVLTLPVGCATNGLPYGLQVAARFGRDEYLLAGASELFRVLSSAECREA